MASQGMHMRQQKKVTEQILRNLAKGVKIVNFWAMEGPNLGDSMGSTLHD